MLEAVAKKKKEIEQNEQRVSYAHVVEEGQKMCIQRLEGVNRATGMRKVAERGRYPQVWQMACGL